MDWARAIFSVSSISLYFVFIVKVEWTESAKHKKGGGEGWKKGKRLSACESLREGKKEQMLVEREKQKKRKAQMIEKKKKDYDFGWHTCFGQT